MFDLHANCRIKCHFALFLQLRYLAVRYVCALTNGTFLGTDESFATAILLVVVFVITMGPIMQERTASATLKRLPAKEKVRMKNAENTGIVARYE